MEKEDILNAAQNENAGKDLEDIEAQKDGAIIATIIGVAVVFLMTFLERMVTGKFNAGYFIILSVMEFGLFIYKYIKLRKTHELVVALLYVALFIGSTVIYILTLTNVI